IHLSAFDIALERPGPQTIPSARFACVVVKEVEHRARAGWKQVTAWTTSGRVWYSSNVRIGNTQPLFTRAHPLAPPRTPPVSPGHQAPPPAAPEGGRAGCCCDRCLPSLSQRADQQHLYV